jgi:hypothetical protein
MTHEISIGGGYQYFSTDVNIFPSPKMPQLKPVYIAVDVRFDQLKAIPLQAWKGH